MDERVKAVLDSPSTVATADFYAGCTSIAQAGTTKPEIVIHFDDGSFELLDIKDGYVTNDLLDKEAIDAVYNWLERNGIKNVVRGTNE